jgi:hypothetical protein
MTLMVLHCQAADAKLANCVPGSVRCKAQQGRHRIMQNVVLMCEVRKVELNMMCEESFRPHSRIRTPPLRPGLNTRLPRRRLRTTEAQQNRIPRSTKRFSLAYQCAA